MFPGVPEVRKSMHKHDQRLAWVSRFNIVNLYTSRFEKLKKYTNIKYAKINGLLGAYIDYLAMHEKM